VPLFLEALRELPRAAHAIGPVDARVLLFHPRRLDRSFGFLLHRVCAPSPQDGWTPLYIAAQNGHSAVVKALIKAGRADVDTVDKVGASMLAFPLCCVI
jgi:hypothetical protein